MAINVECSKKDDLYKTHFSTREGIYNLMSGIEYYRPNRANFVQSPLPLNFVHLSLVSIPGATDNADRLCLNIGRELYIYVYKGIKGGADSTTTVDKKVYKMISPTCHSFNNYCASAQTVPLLVGFNSGIIHLMDMMRKDTNRVFNEEKLVDKTKVTCIKWIPNSRQFFLTSHASGQLYLYNEELPCSTSPPNYQPFKHGDGYTIHVCKTKSTRNPLYRWVIGHEGCSVNEFAFSPCNLYLAVVSQDGFLRVFHYDTMELIGIARSYFGGFLCVSWSPDSKYVAVGGEDDLVTIWSFNDKQVVARGQGHHSWVNVVAFDPYTSIIKCDDEDTSSSSRQCFTTCYRLGSVGQDTQLCLWDLTEDVLRQQPIYNNSSIINPNNNNNKKIKCNTTTTTITNNNNNDNNVQVTGNGEACIVGNSHSYVSHGNLIITNNNNHHHHHHNNNNTSGYNDGMDNSSSSTTSSSNSNHKGSDILDSSRHNHSSIIPSLTQRLASFSFNGGDKRGNGGSSSFGGSKKHSSRGGSTSSNSSSAANYNNHINNNDNGNTADKCNNTYARSSNSNYQDPLKLIGTAVCPRFDQCPLLEPLVCKRITNERLSALIFKEDCIMTSCYDGFVSTWARPGRITHSNAHLVSICDSVSSVVSASAESTSTVV